MERGRIDRARADRVVGTVIAAGLVDRQQLHELEADAARPVDELPQAVEVADAEIVFGAQGEERREDAGDAFVRRKIHAGNDEARMTNDESMSKVECRARRFRFFIRFRLRHSDFVIQLRRTFQSSTRLIGISFRKREGRWNMSP